MTRRAPPRPDTQRLRRAALREAAWYGRQPAEVLDQTDREWLIRRLWHHGWTDPQIAAHTRLSTYTTARIRSRIGLAANTTRQEL